MLNRSEKLDQLHALSEPEFTNIVLIPTFLKKFGSAVNTHGTTELGVDILICKAGDSGKREHLGVVVKAIKIEPKKSTNDVAEQIGMAWKNKRTCQKCGSEITINKVWVITSKSFTGTGERRVRALVEDQYDRHTEFFGDHWVVDFVDENYPDYFNQISVAEGHKRTSESIKNVFLGLSRYLLTENHIRFDDSLLSECKKAQVDPLEQWIKLFLLFFEKGLITEEELIKGLGRKADKPVFLPAVTIAPPEFPIGVKAVLGGSDGKPLVYYQRKANGTVEITSRDEFVHTIIDVETREIKDNSFLCKIEDIELEGLEKSPPEWKIRRTTYGRRGVLNLQEGKLVASERKNGRLYLSGTVSHIIQFEAEEKRLRVKIAQSCNPLAQTGKGEELSERKKKTKKNTRKTK